MATLLTYSAPLLSGKPAMPGTTARAAVLMAGMLLAGTQATQSFAHDEPAHTHVAPTSVSHAAHDHDHDQQEHGSKATHDHGHQQDHGHDHQGHDHAGSAEKHDPAHRTHDAEHVEAAHDAHDYDHAHDHAHEHAHDRAMPEAWAARENPLPLSAEALARGEQVYQQYCSACHGPLGQGDGLAPAVAYFDPSPTNLALHGPAHGAAEYAWIISEGNAESAMPRFDTKLSEKEIWSVVHYIRHGLADEQDEQYAQAHQH